MPGVGSARPRDLSFLNGAVGSTFVGRASQPVTPLRRVRKPGLHELRNQPDCDGSRLDICLRIRPLASLMNSSEPQSLATAPLAVAAISPAVDPQDVNQRLSQISSLVDGIESSGSEVAPASAVAEPDHGLALVRLGMTSSLYLARSSKHAPTAAHALRVALGCSAWAAAMQMPDAEREAIEIAALLHDVGKIGVPDSVLLKPGALAKEESVLMDRFRRTTLDILSACAAPPAVLEIIRHSSAWYDGSRSQGQLSGDQIPIGSRLIAIMDAFDSMTSSQAHRPAMSHERAVKELFACAGTQFDPQLVHCFSDLSERDLAGLRERMAARWLRQFDPSASGARPGSPPLGPCRESRGNRDRYSSRSCSIICTTASSFSTATCA